MKVIWRNNKSVEAGRKNVRSGEIKNELKNPSSHNSLTKMKGYNHRLNNVPREQNLEELTKTKSGTGNKKGLTVSLAKGDTPSSTKICRVCSRNEELRYLDDCTALLDRCFGIKVPDSTAMICKHCADLISHTYKFKEMICAAFQNMISDDVSGNSGSLKEGDSIMSIAKPKATFKSGSEEIFVRRMTTKRKIAANQEKSADNKKTIVVCTACKQRYPMMSKISNFVCSRCKVKSNSDRTIVCVKCKAKVPSSLMREHLERHTTADLKGRCRLRSLTKQSPRAQTDCVSKSHKKAQAKLNCPRCQKSFTMSAQLEKHLREAHGTILMFVCQICKRDMRSADNLDAHMKTHVCIETFECEVCGRIFKDKNMMEKHATFHSVRL